MQVIDEARAAALVSMEAAIEAMAETFAALDRGEAMVFPVGMGHGTDPATRFSMKSGRIDAGGVLGLKVGTYWPGNPARGLPSHGSTTLLLDDATGMPRALVAASHLTALRTAAADALAVRTLSDPAADLVALVGAGHQAWHDLRAICTVRSIREVRIWSRDGAKADRMAARAGAELGVRAKALGLAEALDGAPIVSCATAAQAAVVEAGWIAPGAHISAMGADGPGKQELEVDLVAGARLFADVVEQSVRIGEFQTAAAAGRISSADITTLGAVLNGRAAGRRTTSEITIFDSSGMALQDLAMAELVLTLAAAAG